MKRSAPSLDTTLVDEFRSKLRRCRIERDDARRIAEELQAKLDEAATQIARLTAENKAILEETGARIATLTAEREAALDEASHTNDWNYRYYRESLLDKKRIKELTKKLVHRSDLNDFYESEIQRLQELVDGK